MKLFNRKKTPFLLFSALLTLSLTVPNLALAKTGDVLGGIFNATDFILGITGPFFEVLILPFANTILALAGNLMDSAISFSIHTAYIFSLSPAINIGWSIIRDVANIFFIFILIYISLGTIVRAGSFQTKKLLTSVIIAALLVNFSMFFTKAIIDVSNVFGNWVYSGIQGSLEANSVKGETVALSGLIADRLGIAKFWSGGNTLDKAQTSGQSWRFTNSLIRLIVVLVATYVFAYTAILFMARSIELLILLVFAPLGFVGGLLPQTKKYAEEWWHELGKVAIFPVAFLLMLYIAMQFINSLSSLQVQIGKMTNNLVLAGMPVMTYFQYFIIIFLLLTCLKVAKDNSGKMGEALGGLAKQLSQVAVGAAVNVGSGGIGLLGRATVGRTAAALASGDKIQDLATQKGLLGGGARLTLSALRGTANRSFDMRAMGIAESAGYKGKFGMKAQEGGYNKDIKEAMEKEKKFASEFRDAGDEDKKRWVKEKERVKLEDRAITKAKELTGKEKGKEFEAEKKKQEQLIAEEISKSDEVFASVWTRVNRQAAYAQTVRESPIVLGTPTVIRYRTVAERKRMAGAIREQARKGGKYSKGGIEEAVKKVVEDEGGGEESTPATASPPSPPPSTPTTT